MGLVEWLIIDVIVLGAAIVELVRTRRALRRIREEKARQAAEPPTTAE